MLVLVESRAQDEVSQVKQQVRLADQARYPHVLWPLRWTIAHSTWMVPLLRNSKTPIKREQSEGIPVIPRGTHTHTPPRGEA